MISMWEQLGELKPGQAVLITGVIGFLTLAAGHSFNAWLNRMRDDRLLDTTRKNLLRAIRAEIEIAEEMLGRLPPLDLTRVQGGIMVPHLAKVLPLRTVVQKELLLLSPEQISAILKIQALFDHFDAMIVKKCPGYQEIGVQRWIAAQLGCMTDAKEQARDVLGRIALHRADLFK